MRRYASTIFGDFRCAHCGYWVTSNREFSGVNNRNHCPYCLWSKHLDLFEAGDRMSACKSTMRPVGLTIKRINKKYGAGGVGELMLVHQCQECGKLVANRIAADDDIETILAVYRVSLVRPTQADMEPDIYLLDERHQELVYRQLLGFEYE